MSTDSWQPDFIIGIDFGMTCTAVAYSYGPDWPDPKHIQKWPGKPPNEYHNKVETSVAYNMENGRLEGWGFLCDPDDHSQDTNQYFKLNLDPIYKGPVGDPSHTEACKWYRDYLASIRAHTLQFLRNSFVQFERKRVEFVFSVPTTWQDPRLIKGIEEQIEAAGYGGTPSERAHVTFTEAEAAAVYALRSGMMEGETFVVCDAGGGTSDVNVLKVKSARFMELEALSYTEGRAVGSTVIDFKVKLLIERRLKRLEPFIDGELEAVVDRVMRNSFIGYKCNFGAEGYNVPTYTLPVLELPQGMDDPEAGVKNSKMVITHAELQGIFNDQIKMMQNLIDEQLKIVLDTHGHEKLVGVTSDVHDGGMGSSPYVRRKMKERYESSGSDVPANGRDMTVLLADMPQLVVVHGLVIARIQKVKMGVNVFSQKCCPISVGILCRKEYNEKEHQGEDVGLDPFDKKRWAERQIEWIIKKGDVVDADWGREHKYRRKIEVGREQEPQRTKLVVSTSARDTLPKSLSRAHTRGGVRVCEIMAVLNQSSLRRKNHRWYHLRKEYNLAEFSVKLLVGAGLKFEIVNKDGRCANKHDELPVNWEPFVAKRDLDQTTPDIYP